MGWLIGGAKCRSPTLSIFACFSPRLLTLYPGTVPWNEHIRLGERSSKQASIFDQQTLCFTLILSSYSHSEQVGDSFRKIGAMIAWLLSCNNGTACKFLRHNACSVCTSSVHVMCLAYLLKQHTLIRLGNQRLVLKQIIPIPPRTIIIPI